MNAVNKIKEYMNLSDCTAYKLSKMTNISQATISDWFNGKTKPSLASIIKVAKYFNIPIEELLGD